jgi:hypothetical protein
VSKEDIMNKELKLAHLGLAAVILVMICIAFTGCTSNAGTAPAPVQTTVAEVQTTVPQTPLPTTAPAEQTPAPGKLASAIGSQIPGQVGLVNQSIQTGIANDENMPTAVGVTIPDLPFSQLYPISSAQIIAKTNVMTLPLVASSTTFRAAYSPVTLQLAADDLGYTAEQYHDKITNIKAENLVDEQTRMTYLQYLLIVKNTGYSVRDAAIAEQQGNYQQASMYSQNALTYLDGIKQLPDQSPKSTLNRMEAYIQNYKYTMDRNAQLQASGTSAQDLIQGSNLYKRVAAG